ncbi:MAG TPA: hypothetical protein VFY14_22795 [Streptomyces sp.]|nr:hypothetical protein [Streptomyces sp.]
MAHQIVFVGGPEDGKTTTLRSENLPRVLHQAVNQGSPVSLDEPPSLYPSSKATYQLMLDATGHPSRADDGTYRYEYTGQS